MNFMLLAHCMVVFRLKVNGCLNQLSGLALFPSRRISIQHRFSAADRFIGKQFLCEFTKIALTPCSSNYGRMRRARTKVHAAITGLVSLTISESCACISSRSWELAVGSARRLFGPQTVECPRTAGNENKQKPSKASCFLQKRFPQFMGNFLFCGCLVGPRPLNICQLLINPREWDKSLALQSILHLGCARFAVLINLQSAAEIKTARKPALTI